MIDSGYSGRLSAREPLWRGRNVINFYSEEVTRKHEMAIKIVESELVLGNEAGDRTWPVFALLLHPKEYPSLWTEI